MTKCYWTTLLITWTRLLFGKKRGWEILQIRLTISVRNTPCETNDCL